MLEFGTGLDGLIYSNADDLIIKNQTIDKDIIFNVNDGGVDTEMLRFDADVSQIRLNQDVFTDSQLSQDSNTQFGIGAMGSTLANTTGVEGWRNTAIGNASLGSITTGNDNVTIGYLSLNANTTGIGNTAIGYQAGRFNQTGSSNIYVGKNAGVGVSGNSHSGNTFIGFEAGKVITTGGSNTFIGFGAGDLTTTGANNILIGSSTDAPAAGDNNKINIGNTIYGDLSSKLMGVNVVDPDANWEVMGSTGLKVSFDSVDYTSIVTDTNGFTTITASGGNIGFGLTPTANMAGISVEAGIITLKETTTPTADTDYAKIYSKTDNKLYVQTGDGVEHEIAFV